MKPDEMMVCPHCGYVFDEQAGDFVIPGSIGVESEATENCPGCDKDFICYEDRGEVKARK